MSHDERLPDPARIVLARRIEWIDTDAAGIYHWTTAFRLAEAAEAALHTALGIEEVTFGATPRVAVSASFVRPLRFNDPVDVELAVVAIGRTSLDYRFTISAQDGQAAEARSRRAPDRAHGARCRGPRIRRSLWARPDRRRGCAALVDADARYWP